MALLNHITNPIIKVTGILSGRAGGQPRAFPGQGRGKFTALRGTTPSTAASISLSAVAEGLPSQALIGPEAVKWS